MMEFNQPYNKPTDANQIKDDAHRLFHCMQKEDLVNLVSTYFKSDQLAELIDDRLMGRV